MQTEIEEDKVKIRNVFDSLKDISNVAFKTDKGKEIQQGLLDAWIIIKPYLITMAKELK